MLKKLNDLLKQNDAVLINSPHNLRYFTGFTGGEGYALITLNGAYLFCDGRYTEQAKNEAEGFEIIEHFGSALYEKLNDLLLFHGINSIAYEDNFITQREFLGFNEKLSHVTFVPSSDEIEHIRAVKEDWEIERLKQAFFVSDNVFSHVLNYIKVGVCERDIATEIEYFMKKNGAERTSFDTIVVSGARSALPHGLPTGKRLEHGDFVTMDFGCIFDGYCSDMTRTVVIGESSSEQKKIYATVLSAQCAAIEIIKEGVCCMDADTVARDIITQAGYEDYFKHSLGHGVGLLIHEEPRLSPKSGDVLKGNMIVTVEPGIYVPNLGGVRIEDTVCVKKDGIYNFVQSPKELIEVN